MSSDNVVEIRITSKDVSDAGFKSAEVRAETSGAKITETLSRAGERAGEALTRGIDGRLRDSRGRFVKHGEDAGAAVGEGLTRGAAGAFGQFMSLIGSVATGAMSTLFSLGGTTAATGGVNLLVGALLGLVAAAAAAVAGLILLAPVLLVVGGAAGASTTLLAGLGATVAVLGMGLGGLGDAWAAAGQKASGGGASASAAAKMAERAQRELKSAVQSLADAQRSALQAQLAVTAARESEVERLEGLSRSVRSARLDEEGAVLAVARAEQRLRDLRRSGASRLEIKEAELAYRQAQLAVEDIQDRLGDLTKEQEDSTRKGVEGSDQVQSALERQEQAQRQLEQATWRLADAQKAVAEGAGGAAGGVDRFAEAMAKLSPNARSLIKTLIELKPRFDALKTGVQDRLLEGSDTVVKDLATKWLPVLTTSLGDIAGRFNGIGKTLAESLGKPDFISNITTALGGFGRFVERIGTAVAGPLVDAFGRLSAASVPFLEALGDKIGGLVENFSAWIKTADESDSLSSFMDSAVKALNDIWDIGGLTLGILGEIVSILWPASKKEGATFLGGLKERLEELKEWLGDPDNQQKIQDWIDKIQNFAHEAARTAEKVGGFIDTVSGWVEKVDGWATSIGKTKDKIRSTASGLFDPIKDAFRASLNWVIDRWNGLRFSLPSVNFFGTEIGGGSIGTSWINRFAQGGIGGGMAWVGERGRELVNLPHGSQVIPHGQSEAMAAAGGGEGGQRMTLVIDLRNASSEIRALLQKIVKSEGGGSVELAFGTVKK